MAKKLGRPRIPQKNRLAKTVSLRLTRDEMAELRRLAERAGKTASDLVREALFDDKKAAPPRPAK